MIVSVHVQIQRSISSQATKHTTKSEQEHKKHAGVNTSHKLQFSRKHVLAGSKNLRISNFHIDWF